MHESRSRMGDAYGGVLQYFLQTAEMTEKERFLSALRWFAQTTKKIIQTRTHVRQVPYEAFDFRYYR